MGRIASNFREMEVYQEAFAFQQEVFEVSKSWPKEEMYALTDQARRSTRSIGANFAEAWAKRRYEAHFISKLTDCDGECGETETSLDFACDCGYISEEQHHALVERNNEVGRLLGAMLNNPSKWTLKS